MSGLRGSSVEDDTAKLHGKTKTEERVCTSHSPEERVCISHSPSCWQIFLLFLKSFKEKPILLLPIIIAVALYYLSRGPVSSLCVFFVFLYTSIMYYDLYQSKYREILLLGLFTNKKTPQKSFQNESPTGT